MSKHPDLRSIAAPQDATPRICRGYGCVYFLEHTVGSHAERAHVYAFVHKNGQLIDRHTILASDLADESVDVWGEQIRPWIESLPHE